MIEEASPPGDEGLDPDQAAHCQLVRAAVADALDAAGGWLSFERYMELVMYAPGIGYYSAGARKFGRGGDFVTAPESSRLFGACVARQCAEILESVERGCILELGAGSGNLAVDVLSRLEMQGRLPSEYFILEVSADLRERQAARIQMMIPHLARRVSWLDGPPPAPFDGVVLANEVLDALPVMRFRWHDSHCEELGVASNRGRLTWASRPASAAVMAACSRLAASADGWEAGYVSEYCPRLGPWTRAACGPLRRGCVLWFDYGLPRAQYYLGERHEGTLICHFRQRPNDDPFSRPGLQDISAWVDFTALAEAGATAGYEIAGFTTQAHFLAGLAIDEEMRSLARGDAGTFARLANEAKRLMLPGGMGECFKAMAWVRGRQPSLSGFALRDLRHQL